MTLLGSRRLSVVLTVALAVVGVLTYLVVWAGVPEGSTPRGPHGLAAKAGMHASYDFPPEDERRLVGASENVFLGRVVEKSGTGFLEGTPEPPGVPESPGTPETRFSVEVLRTVKGNLTGQVTVNQHGGYHQGTDSLMLMDGDPLLVPGRVYLLSTNPAEGRGWQQIVAAPFGDVPAETQNERDALVRKFAEARRNQIPPDEGGAPEAPGDPGP